MSTQCPSSRLANAPQDRRSALPFSDINPSRTSTLTQISSIWREPEAAKDPEAKQISDLTAHHARTRSAIRRQPTVRISNSARNSYSGSNRISHARRALAGSPPPEPSIQDIPPVPDWSGLRPLQLHDEAQTQEERRVRTLTALGELHPTETWPSPWPLPRSESPHTSHELNYRPPPSIHGNGVPSFSPVEDPLPDQYRPRRRDARANALDELPPLRRMGNRTINEALPRITQFSVDETRADDLGMTSGLGDRERSWSPEADQWETLLTTITPDPSIPSADSSFANANTSQVPNAGSTDNARRRRRPQRPISALRETIGRRPGRRARSPAAAAPDDPQLDDNCPLPPMVPSQGAQLSFGEILRDAEAIPPRPSSPPLHTMEPRHPQEQTMPRSIVDPDRMPMIQQLLEAQGESRNHHQRTHDYFTDFIRAFIRGDRTESEAQLTIRAFDRLAHYMTAERTYHNTRMPERAQERESDSVLRNLRQSGDHDEIDRWLFDHITDFDTEQRELEDAVREVNSLRDLLSRRPLDQDEITRRDQLERFLGEAAEESRRARNERIRRDGRRGRGVQERL